MPDIPWRFRTVDHAEYFAMCHEMRLEVRRRWLGKSIAVLVFFACTLVMGDDEAIERATRAGHRVMRYRLNGGAWRRFQR